MLCHNDFALDIIATTEEPSPGLSATLSHHCVTGEGTREAGANGRGHYDYH